MSDPDTDTLIIRTLGQRSYLPVWHAMQSFTAQQTADTMDELWIVEHDPIYTLGLNAKPTHVLDPGKIPVLQVDRGGQVTYHGPGQLVLYPLLDLKRRGLGIRQLVNSLEQSVISLLADYGLQAESRRDAPGVYIGAAKIAALGLRVRHGRSYHGLALNIDMDLTPFGQINPCGYPGMPVTQLRDETTFHCSNVQLAQQLLTRLSREIGYNLLYTETRPDLTD